MSDLRLVVFDMDGTLIDSQNVIIAAMARAFDKMGLPRAEDAAVRGIIGLSLEEAVQTLAPHLTMAEAVEGANLYRQGFVDLRAEGGAEAAAPLYDGALAALERLHAQDETLLGVATGKARRGLEHAYKTHDIGRFFVTSQTADNHPSKPHPSMLYQCLADTGCEVGQAVMVGDTEFDIEMGKAAGFTTIAVTWGYHPLDRLQAAGADFVIDRFDDLDATLDEIWGQG